MRYNYSILENPTKAMFKLQCKPKQINIKATLEIIGSKSAKK